ncbi:hypothetical protein [Gaetbulibacter jejuensis]|uniref:hypothetical protein n=1 Tax=Gaetbulibacter jejuensis TaxID=584607 RepID=UPI00300B7A9A
MNRIFLLVVFLAMVCLTSCQFSENIYINEDGSGKMEFSMDASELMQMAGEKMKEDGTERMDSTIVFKDFLDEKRDSISKLPQEDQDKLKALENFKMHMLMDTETSVMKFDLLTDFKDAGELQDMFQAMNSVGNMQGEGGMKPADASNPFSSLGSNSATDIKYTFKKGVFKRSAKIIDTELHQQAMDSLSSMEMMFATSNYTLNYHFPKPIKSVSNEAAMFSDDRKSFTLEVNFMESLKNPALLDVEVILED